MEIGLKDLITNFKVYFTIIENYCRSNSESEDSNGLKDIKEKLLTMEKGKALHFL